MLDGISNYPLTWPVGWARIPAHKRQPSQFADRSIAKAVQYVLEQVRLLNGKSVIVSTNLQLRNDGLPRSGQKRPDDPGAAVYFVLKGKPRVLACDKWTLVEDNLWAIGKHIEAIRGQDRWGVGTIDQAFAGYEALPAPKSTWWDILGVSQRATDGEVSVAYRSLAKTNHPDTGGNQEEFLRIQGAYEQWKKERNL
jgi:hypothetical protein